MKRRQLLRERKAQTSRRISRISSLSKLMLGMSSPSDSRVMSQNSTFLWLENSLIRFDVKFLQLETQYGENHVFFIPIN